jgi:DNA replication and repair protein RecF
MLTRLILQNYRNYPYAQWVFDQSFVFLCGDNGTGKTNILEAISLLNVPKGLRSVDVKDLGRYDNDNNQHQDWTVFYDLAGSAASIESREGKKTIRLHQKTSSQKQLREYVRVFWVAPENDRLFAGTPSDRRNFIHQLIEISHPEYGTLYSQYMHYIQERSQILRMPHHDAVWLDRLESNIADLARQIYTARNDFIATLNGWIKQLNHFHYHRFEMHDESFDDLAAEIKNNRSYDQIRGGCKVGPHKSDLVGYRYDMPLHLCSNGQQCIGLFSILLGLVKQHSQTQPVLFLIDEIFSHLDKTHQNLLIQELKSMPSVQTFITLPHLAHFPEAQVILL